MRKNYKDMGFYYSYINSEAWQQVRKRFRHSSLPKCCYVCGRDDLVLHLHHRSYKSLGHENLTHLVRVCPPCHRTIHKIEREEGVHIWQATKMARKRHRKLTQSSS